MVKKKTRQKSSSPRPPKDRATHYARQVVAGKIVAGPHVRNACARHLKDLKEGPKRGLFWDLNKANLALEFFEVVLRLNGGEFEGIPFVPEDWQAFCIGSLFGWIVKATGYRRFKTAYVETGKGSGKSPMAAGIGLYGLMSDGEKRAEIYAAATKKDQAQILFRDAVAMVDQSPELSKRLKRSGTQGKEWNLAYLETNSFFRTLSSDKSQSGTRPHIGLIDEIHEHKDATAVEMIASGVKFRRQPITFLITNSGSDKTSICGEWHEFGISVCNGTKEDDTLFAYICALDKGDKPLKNERCWLKANPSLGVTIKKEYLRDQVIKARGMPSKESVVRRLNFCEWVGAKAPAIAREVWEVAEQKFPKKKLRGRACVGGLDLSSTTDLTSLVLLFEPTKKDPVFRLLSFFWLPEDGLKDREDRDRVPYLSWQRKGFLKTTPGAAVSKLFVAQFISGLQDKYDIKGIAYDRWRIKDLKQMAQDDGLTMPEMIDFGQGFQSMGPAFENFEEKLVNEEMKHDGHPILTMCAANCVVDISPAGDRKPNKEKATGRIDGIVATIMACGVTKAKLPKKSPYEKRGLRTL